MNRCKAQQLAAVAISFLTVTNHAPGAAVTWDVDADGDWNIATNWSSNPSLPGAADDVTIDVGGATIREITHALGTDTILSLTTDESITMDGGSSILVTGAASFTTDNTTLSANAAGTLFEADGATTVDGVNLMATSGGVLRLDQAASYTHNNNGVNKDRTISADDTGSLVDLSGATSISGSGGALSDLFITANSGGTVNFSSVTTIDGPSGGGGNPRGVEITSSGASSLVDFSDLTSFTNDATNPSSLLEPADGGEIRVPILTTLGGVDIILDGTGTMSTSQITTYNNGHAQVDGTAADFSGVTDATDSEFTVTGGGTIDLSTATSINSTGFDVNDGVTLALPAATSYTHDTSKINNDRTLKATGASSVLDLSNLTSFTGANSGGALSDVFVEALDGGEVDLSGVLTISGNAGGSGNPRGIQFTADGTSSTIDLATATTFSDPATNSSSLLKAVDSGTINAPLLTTLFGVDLFIDGTGTLPVAQYLSYNDGQATLDGTAANFVALTDIEGSEFTVQDGGNAILNVASSIDRSGFHVGGGVTLSMPAATTYAHDTTKINDDRTLAADGAGSTLDLSTLTSIAGAPGPLSDLAIEATDGGKVDISNVTSITVPSGGTSNKRGVQLAADGLDVNPSTIDGSMLTTFEDNSPNPGSSIHASNSGSILLPNLMSVSGVNVVLDSTGSLTLAAALELADKATLSGNGTITADVTNTAGSVAPGESAGQASITGNYTQAAAATLDIELGGTTPGTDYDVLGVTGTATLQANTTVVITLIGDPEFEPSDGDTFDILLASVIDDQGAIYDFPELAGGLQFFPSIVPQGISAQALRVTIGIPEPSAIALTLAGALALTSRRRRASSPSAKPH